MPLALCPTCNRPTTDPWTKGPERWDGAPLNEHCADPCHFSYLTEDGEAFLRRNLWSTYSGLATKARGHNTPSARRADEAWANYDRFDRAVSARRAS